MSAVELNPVAQSATVNPPAAEAEHKPVSKELTLAQILASCESSLPISIQSAYAGTQLAQAKLCKDQSQAKLDDLRKIQERQAKITDLIARVRQEKVTSPGAMSKELFNEMKALGLSTDPNVLAQGWLKLAPGADMDKLINEMQKAWDNSKEGSVERRWLDDWLPSIARHRKEGKAFVLSPENERNLRAALERCGSGTMNAFRNTVQSGNGGGEHFMAPQDDQKWEYNLKSMTNYQEQVGTKTQSTMVMLQDFIGQYNSFLQGASTAIDRANQLLSKLTSGQQ